MPYRRAHWYLLLLLPLIVIAFWPGYFGQLRDASWALHGHGVSATAWLMLLALELWAIHSRRAALHRTAGRAIFVVVPIFAGASLAAIHGGFALFTIQSDPFHGTFSARLGMVDLIALATFLGLVWQALAQRRQPRVHAAAMLATALLVLPPILGRLVPLVPEFGAWDVAGRHGFALAFYMGQALATLFALALYAADRKAQPFLVVALANILQCLVFETVAAADWWARLAVGSLAVPAVVVFLTGAVIAAAVLRDGWMRTPPRGRTRAHPAVVTV